MTSIKDLNPIVKLCQHGPKIDDHNKFNALQWNALKKQHNAVTLFGVLGATVTMGAFFGLRALLMHPEVSINRRKNPEPWNAYKHGNREYRLFHVVDDAIPPCPAPDY